MISSRNNFDLLRLLLASGVVLAHLYDLTREPFFLPLRKCVDSESCVYGFFAISGFLITLSYQRSSDFRQFALKRIRRLVPAYIVVVLFCFVLGFLMTSQPRLTWLTTSETWDYLLFNLLFLEFLQPTLPGVFTENPVNNSMNAALWSIRVELICYLLVPVWMSIRKRCGDLLTWFGLLLATQTIDLLMQSTSLGLTRWYLWHIGFLIPICFFATGSLLYLHHEKLAAWTHYVFPTSVIILMLTIALPDHTIPISITIIALSITVICFGNTLPYLGNWGRYGDISYGVYIYHYPLLQTLIALGLFQHSPLLAAVVVFIFALTAGWLSWQFIEKPFLSRKSHYVKMEKG